MHSRCKMRIDSNECFRSSDKQISASFDRQIQSEVEVTLSFKAISHNVVSMHDRKAISLSYDNRAAYNVHLSDVPLALCFFQETRSPSGKKIGEFKRN